MKKAEIVDVDSYIATFPEHVREQLETLRALIQKTAPNAQEVISYQMPAYKQNGILVYFAGYKNHIGFYPTATPILAFKKELMPYKTTKGAVQFPLGKTLPKSLIRQMVKFRLAELKQNATHKNPKT